MNPRPIIHDLMDALKTGAYEKCQQDFDKLADAIRVEELDKHYRDHPEETNG